jgi:hypothetical protein
MLLDGNRPNRRSSHSNRSHSSFGNQCYYELSGVQLNNSSSEHIPHEANSKSRRFQAKVLFKSHCPKGLNGCPNGESLPQMRMGSAKHVDYAYLWKMFHPIPRRRPNTTGTDTCFKANTSQ